MRLHCGWHRETNLKSAYIRQMYAHLRSQEGNVDGMADGAPGLLLHPMTGSDMNTSAEFQGHRIRFVTIALTTSVLDIRNRLLQVIQVPDTEIAPAMVR